MTEITFEYGGTTHIAEYEVIGDTLTVFLADGSTRETVLRGLNPESAAMTHLRSFAFALSKRNRNKDVQ